MSHKKFGPDRFSRFDVYWIQTDRQTDKQTNKQTSQIYILINKWVFWEYSIKRGQMEYFKPSTPDTSLLTYSQLLLP